MWIVVIGGIGTCKKAVVDHLSKVRGYRQVSTVFPPLDVAGPEYDVKFVEQTNYLMARYKDGHACKKLSADEDMISVRGFWDTHVVFSEFFRQKGMLRKENHWALSKFYNEMVAEIPPPSGFILLKNTTLFSLVRKQLGSGTDFSDEDVKLIAQLYDDFAKTIRVPVVEVDVNRPFNEVCDEVIFGLDSVQTTASFGQSIWERRLF
jgi:hypothetical protein